MKFCFFFSRQNEIILLGEKRTALSKLIIGNSQILFNTLVRVFARLYAKTCDGGSRARYAPPPVLKGLTENIEHLPKQAFV